MNSQRVLCCDYPSVQSFQRIVILSLCVQFHRVVVPTNAPGVIQHDALRVPILLVGVCGHNDDLSRVPILSTRSNEEKLGGKTLYDTGNKEQEEMGLQSKSLVHLIMICTGVNLPITCCL